LPRSKSIVLVGVVSIATLVAASWVLLDASSGLLAFRLWRTLAPEAHGGRYIAVNGIRLYCETFGRGPPVLVLHGGLGSLEDMGNQIRALASDRLVIAPDSRAHGRSGDTDAPLSYRLMADDILKLLDALRLRRVDIVGWSDGGIIGLEIAIRHPERLGHLVVIGTNYDSAGLKELPTLPAEVPSPRGFYRRNLLDPARWEMLYRKVVTMWQNQPHYTAQELGLIRAPTLVIAGEYDVVRPQHTDELARAIPGAQEAIISGGTHMLPTQKPAIVNASILRFLDEPLP
jgi:pimeloyl-ACP methyl ester carboxylesterase